MKDKLIRLLRKPEYFFLIFALIFGLVIIIVNPPFHSPDEIAHFLRAYELSEGKVFSVKGEIAPGVYRYGDYLPSSIQKIYDIYGTDEPVSKSKIREGLNVRLNPGDKRFIAFNNTAVYSPIPYIPQTIGIVLAKLTNRPLILIYFAKLANLVFALALVFFAIKKTPFLKWGFVIVALMPMSVYQFASISADSSTIIYSFLTVSFILYFLKNEKNKLIDFIILGVLALLLGLSKQAYFLIPLMAIIIPSNRFKGNRNKFLYLFILGLLVLPTLIWSNLVKHMYLDDQLAFASEKLHFIISMPVKYILIFFTDLLDHGGQYFNQMIGYLGQLTLPLPLLIVHIPYLILLVFSVIGDKDSNFNIGRINKLFIFSLALGTVFIVATSLYIFWTSGKNFIEGIQGRYFIPILPLILSLLVTKNISLKIELRNKHIYLACFIAFIILVTLFSFITKYY